MTGEKVLSVTHDMASLQTIQSACRYNMECSNIIRKVKLIRPAPKSRLEALYEVPVLSVVLRTLPISQAVDPDEEQDGNSQAPHTKANAGDQSQQEMVASPTHDLAASRQKRLCAPKKD